MSSQIRMHFVEINIELCDCIACLVVSSFETQLLYCLKFVKLANLRCSQRKVTMVNRKPKAEPNENRMQTKALELLRFESEFHRME